MKVEKGSIRKDGGGGTSREREIGVRPGKKLGDQRGWVAGKEFGEVKEAEEVKEIKEVKEGKRAA